MRKLNYKKFSRLLLGMREAYENNSNMMEWARKFSKNNQNTLQATMIAYDLQAGSYVANTEKNPEYNKIWGAQLSEFINLKINEGDSVLEIGVGEATTLCSVYKNLKFKNIQLFGFDISWSRLFVAKNYLKNQNLSANLFVADLFNIPLADESIDVVYTSHSLEPNGGKERDAIKECLRVTRKALILFEPIFELASEEAKNRMSHHGYVKNLKNTAEDLGAKVEFYQLLKKYGNELNPTGVILLTKKNKNLNNNHKLVCPITKSQLFDHENNCFVSNYGLVYPIINGIPVLRSENAILCSKFPRP